MEDNSGGWTVFQRRIDGTVNFKRNWTEYKNGFGDLKGNFWLGLEKIHRLTNANHGTILRVDIRHKNGKNGSATYGTFRVNNEKDKYRLTVGGYSGNATDSLTYHNQMFFSTYDVSNNYDPSRHCGRAFSKLDGIAFSKGGWWYKDCPISNLNGEYPVANGSTNLPNFIDWYEFMKEHGNIVFSEMKIM